MVVLEVSGGASGTISIFRPDANPDRIDIYVSAGLSSNLGVSIAAGLATDGRGLLEGFGAAGTVSGVTVATGVNSQTGLPNGATGVTVTVASTPTVTVVSTEASFGVYAGSMSEDAGAVVGARAEIGLWNILQVFLRTSRGF
jgi:hypothetical protein